MSGIYRVPPPISSPSLALYNTRYPYTFLKRQKPGDWGCDRTVCGKLAGQATPLIRTIAPCDVIHANTGPQPLFNFQRRKNLGGEISHHLNLGGFWEWAPQCEPSAFRKQPIPAVGGNDTFFKCAFWLGGIWSSSESNWLRIVLGLETLYKHPLPA